MFNFMQLPWGENTDRSRRLTSVRYQGKYNFTQKMDENR